MAILSNINGKFSVDSAGAVYFGTSAGANLQVLQSVGITGSPTWVNVVDIIGGPYLPLTGGDLAGDGNLLVGGTLTVNGVTTLNAALTGTTATFSGIITAQSSSSGDYVRLYGSSGTGKWDIYGNGANLRISDNESAGILAVDTGATFGGNITANTGSKITSSSTDTTFSIETTSGTTIFPILDFVSSHSSVGGQIRQGGTKVIGFDKSLNANFAGTISSGALTVGNSGTSRFTDTSAFPLQLSRGLDVDSVGANGAVLGIGTIKNGTYKDGVRISGGLEVNGTDGNFTLQTLGGGTYTTALSINSSQNATFAGDVFSGGLYVNSTSAVSGTQVAIVKDGAQNLQRWGSTNNGSLQASYRFRVDQNFEFIGNSGSGDTITLKSSDGSATFSGIVGMGSTGIYAGTNAQLNLPGRGLAIKNDKNGSNNNWSYIENTATGSQSNINFYTGNNVAALTLDHVGDATFTEDVILGSGKYLGVGNTTPAGTRSKFGVSINVTGTAANLAESVTYATMELYPYRNGSTYGMFFGNRGVSAGYIQTANSTGNDSGPINLNPFGGSVGIGIGNTTPSYTLDVSGTIRATGDVIAYSDERVKENIKTIDNSLEKVSKLRGVSYTRNDIEDNSTKIGVIAQEVLKVLPEVVEKDKEGKYSVAYGNIVGVLIESIKELEARVKELENK